MNRDANKNWMSLQIKKIRKYYTCFSELFIGKLENSCQILLKIEIKISIS